MQVWDETLKSIYFAALCGASHTDGGLSECHHQRIDSSPLYFGFLRLGSSHPVLGPEGLPHASSMGGRLLRRGLAPRKAFSPELCKLPGLEM